MIPSPKSEVCLVKAKSSKWFSGVAVPFLPTNEESLLIFAPEDLQGRLQLEAPGVRVRVRLVSKDNVAPSLNVPYRPQKSLFRASFHWTFLHVHIILPCATGP
jgi:hypothetical protein